MSSDRYPPGHPRTDRPKFDRRKAFGQHFLKDEKVIEKIVGFSLKAFQESGAQEFLEIGPGDGALTTEIFDHAPNDFKLTLAERDRNLIEKWKPHPWVKDVWEGDFVSFELPQMAYEKSWFVMSNLPYSAGTAIAVKLLEWQNVPEMVLMFQKEVSDRIIANPSTPDRGSLSLLFQNEFEIQELIIVPPSAFTPPPKVQSSVLYFKRRSKPILPDFDPQKDRELFSDLLKKAFSQRRKMIRKNLAGTRWEAALKTGSVSEEARAEALEWKDWIALWSVRSLKV